MRNENETYQDYRNRLRQEKAELKAKKKGVTVWVPQMGTAIKQRMTNVMQQMIKRIDDVGR